MKARSVITSRTKQMLQGIATRLVRTGGLDLIAQLLRENRELRRAAALAERSSRAKAEFLAHMSHEIRTPLSSVLGFAELLLEPGQGEFDKQQALLTIRRNARHLSELINSILDLSKIEAGEMTVQKVVCDLPELVREIASLTRAGVEGKGLELRVTCDGPVPRQIKTDPLRLRQILVNLIGNAQRFTQEGHIELRVGYEKQLAITGEGALRFAVTDTGIGMTEQQVARLFRAYSQADESTSRQFGGTGLGLAISKSLAGLLGGDISVVSKLGAGSTFTVAIDPGPIEGVELVDQLPLGEVESPIPLPPPRVGLAGRVLLAEDGIDNQRLIALHLRRAGAAVEIAQDGKIALDLLSREQFDLVLMDMQMPQIDGCTATRELRRRGMSLPVVALTARASTSDRQMCLDAGCDEYLTKPIDRHKLLAVVQRYLPEGPAPMPISEQPLRSELSDDPELADVLQEFVQTLPEKINRLYELLTRRDLDELRRFAHQIKGAAGGYGFPHVTARAADLESQLHRRARFDEVAETVAELTAIIRRIDGYPAAIESSTAQRNVA